jgi:hypothetical protein
MLCRKCYAEILSGCGKILCMLSEWFKGGRRVVEVIRVWKVFYRWNNFIDTNLGEKSLIP